MRRMTGYVASPIGWALMSEPWEMLPFNDIHSHVGGPDCWCRPDLNEEDVLVHNAADRREDYIERNRKRH